MTLTDLRTLKTDGDFFLVDKEIKEVQNCLVINGWIAFPITCSYSYNRTNDILLSLPNGTNIGRLKFLKLKEIADVTSLPDEEYICFLSEYNKSSIVDPSYKFTNDFLLLNETHLNDYLAKWIESSSIWGSFFHVDQQPIIAFTKKASISNIEVLDGIRIDNSIYKENLFLSITEPNPINRFLKLYHLLELQFDLHTAVLISRLLQQGGREKEISSKLRDYNRDEDERLESLVKEKCKNLTRLVTNINLVTSFLSEANTIFYEYGKTKNPLKRTDFTNLTTSTGKFSKTSVDSIGGYSFESLIPKLTSYWIYRVRCCVAHNRFGEYILTVHDEKFIVEFAEPLLKEVIIQSFTT